MQKLQKAKWADTGLSPQQSLKHERIIKPTIYRFQKTYLLPSALTFGGPNPSHGPHRFNIDDVINGIPDVLGGQVEVQVLGITKNGTPGLVTDYIPASLFDRD